MRTCFTFVEWIQSVRVCKVSANEKLILALYDQWEARQGALESREHTGLVCDVTPGVLNLLLPQLKPNKTPAAASASAWQ